MRHLLLVAAVAILPACGGGHRTTEIVVPVPGTNTTELLIQATNYDVFEYAIWLEWQEPSGAWDQTYLFSVYEDPSIGPIMDFSMLTLSANIAYTVLLTDPWDGYVYDSYVVWGSPGFRDAYFQIIGGVLVRY